MSNALLGYGTVFNTGDGNSPEVFTAFEEVSGVDLPKPAVDVIDTSHEMPPGSVREPMAGFTDYGEVQISFNFIPGNTSAASLMTELGTHVVRHRQVVFANGHSFAFSGFLKSFESSQATGDKLGGTATFQVVGAATLT